MIYRLGLKTEAEPRVPCVPRREPGNENVARVGKKVTATTTVWFPGSGLGTSICLQARPENRGGASGALRSQAGAWEREW